MLLHALMQAFLMASINRFLVLGLIRDVVAALSILSDSLISIQRIAYTSSNFFVLYPVQSLPASKANL